MYVGYMYTSGQVHGLGTDSTIKDVLDNWYTSNLQNYADKIDGNAGFCNDRMQHYGTGIGASSTDYATYNRLINNKIPSFECSNSNDLFTTKESSEGNKSLQYPIGLITADEVAYAGGVEGISNTSYYLYTNNEYWTMSPYRYKSNAFVFYVSSSGSLNSAKRVDASYGIRPVINLKSTVQITGGNGLKDTPYIIN